MGTWTSRFAAIGDLGHLNDLHDTVQELRKDSVATPLSLSILNGDLCTWTLIGHYEEKAVKMAYCSSAVAGDMGTARVGKSGNATAGVGGKVSAGYSGYIALAYWVWHEFHGLQYRKRRFKISQIKGDLNRLPEKGLRAYTWYRLDRNNEFEPFPIDKVRTKRRKF